jgi:DNA replication protein DnaC
MQAELQNLMAQLRLQGMARSLPDILASADTEALPVREVLHRLLAEELRHCQERSLAYRLGKARLPWDWSLETFPFDQQPGVNAVQIKGLAGLDFIQRAQNVVFIGPPGTGKSGLAIGLLRQALLNGYRGRFYKAQELFDELYASLADRSTSRLLKQLSRYDIIQIDELGYLTLKPEQVNAFFKLLDMRYGRRSTLITTNIDYPDWYDLFQRKPLVDALLDRLQHHCITIRIDGPSLRIPDAEPVPTRPKRHRKKTTRKQDAPPAGSTG